MARTEKTIQREELATSATENERRKNRLRKLLKRVRDALIGIFLLPTVLTVGIGALQAVEATAYIVQHGLDLGNREDLKTFVREYLIPKLRGLYPQRDAAAFTALMDLVDDFGVKALEVIDLQMFLHGTNEEARSTLLFTKYFFEMSAESQENLLTGGSQQHSNFFSDVRSDLYEHLGPFDPLTQLQEGLAQSTLSEHLQGMVYKTVNNTLSVLAELELVPRDGNTQALLSEATEIAITLFQEISDEDNFPSQHQLGILETQIISIVVESQSHLEDGEDRELLKGAVAEIFATFYRLPSFDEVEYFFSFIRRFDAHTPVQLVALVRVAQQLTVAGSATDQTLSPGAHALIQEIITETKIPPQAGDSMRYLDRLFGDETYIARLGRFLTILRTSNHRLSHAAYLNYFSLHDDAHIDQLLQLLGGYNTLAELEPGLLERHYRMLILPTIRSAAAHDEVLEQRAVMFADVFAQAALENPTIASALLVGHPSDQLITLILEVLSYDQDLDSFGTEVPADQRAVMTELFTTTMKVICSTPSTADANSLFYGTLYGAVSLFRTHREGAIQISPQLEARIRTVVDSNPQGFAITLSLLAELRELPLDEALSAISALEQIGTEITKNQALYDWFLDHPDLALATLARLEIKAYSPIAFHHRFFAQTLAEMQIATPDNVEVLLAPLDEGPVWSALYGLLPTLSQTNNQEQVVTHLLTIADIAPELAEVFFRNMWFDEPAPLLLDHLIVGDLQEVRGATQLLYDRLMDGQGNDVAAFVLAQFAYGNRLDEDVSLEVERVLSEQYLPLREAIALLVDSNGDSHLFLEQLNQIQVEKNRHRMTELGLTEEDQERVLSSLAKDQSLLSIPKNFSDVLREALAYTAHHEHVAAFFTTHPDAAAYPTQTLFILNTLFRKMDLELAPEDLEWVRAFTSLAAPILAEYFADVNTLANFETLIGYAIDQQTTSQEDFALLLIEHGYGVGLGISLTDLSQEDVALLREGWREALLLRSRPFRSSLMDFPELMLTYLRTEDDTLRSALHIIYQHSESIGPRFIQLLQTNTSYENPTHPLHALAQYFPTLRSLPYTSYQRALIVDAILMPTMLSTTQNIALIEHLLNTLTPEQIVRMWEERFGLHSILVRDYGAVEESKAATYIRTPVSEPTVIRIEKLAEHELAHSTLYLNAGLLYLMDGQIIQYDENNQPIDVSQMSVGAFRAQYRDHHFLVATPTDGGELIQVLSGEEFVANLSSETTLEHTLQQRGIRTFTLVNVMIRDALTDQDQSFFELLRNQSSYVDFLGLTKNNELLFLSLKDGDLEELFADNPNLSYLLPIDIGRTSVLYSRNGQTSGTDTLVNDLVIAVLLEAIKT